MPKKPKKTKTAKAPSLEADPSKKPKRKDPVGGEEGNSRTQALRQAYLAVQIKAMQRAAEPLTVKYSMETVHEIKQFNHTLANMVFSRQLGHHDIQALNGIIRNQLQILIPHPGVTQNVQVAGPQITVNFDKLVEKLTPDEQTVLSRAIARLEAQAQSG